MVLQKQFFPNQDPFFIQKVNKTKKLVDFVVKALKVVIFFLQPSLISLICCFHRNQMKNTTVSPQTTTASAAVPESS